MELSLIYFLVGLILLVIAADRFVTGAAGLARHYGISPLLIGLTIVALGTSAPEIVVSLMASLKGEPALAIGNAIGSNIANVGLVLGCSALLAPLKVKAITLKREFPILLFVTLLTIVLLINGYFSRLDGIILLVVLIVVLGLSIWYAIHHQRQRAASEADRRILKPKTLWLTVFWLVAGGVAIPFCSELLINGAIGLAQYFGISEFVIGLSVVAIGTSLPELATSIVAILKGEHDISIGNIIGSNVFNLVAVLPFPGIIAPTALNPSMLYRDLPVLLLSTVAIFVVGYSIKDNGKVTRLEGFFLLLGYVIFLYFVFK